MSKTFELILDLIQRKDIKVSDHGYDELADDDIFVREIMAGVGKAIVSKIILSIQRDHAFWCYRKMLRATRST